jgi:hypothetical protein
VILHLPFSPILISISPLKHRGLSAGCDWWVSSTVAPYNHPVAKMSIKSVDEHYKKARYKLTKYLAQPTPTFLSQYQDQANRLVRLLQVYLNMRLVHVSTGSVEAVVEQTGLLGRRDADVQPTDLLGRRDAEVKQKALEVID